MFRTSVWALTWNGRLWVLNVDEGILSTKDIVENTKQSKSKVLQPQLVLAIVYFSQRLLQNICIVLLREIYDCGRDCHLTTFMIDCVNA